MGTIDIVVAIIVGIAGLAAGLFVGAMPAFTSKLSEQQNRVQQWAGIILIVVFFLLMYFKLNISSWSIIIAAIAGFALAKIPALHQMLIAMFPILQPKKEEKPKPRPAQNQKPKKKNSKKRKHTH
ncbi:hypothetical protein OZX62_04620 [Bifidobacterium sp. ESL0690]|uniref:hypothetical protein n=1 Tax=Bifidobacterium sp. ESL0690 TaxID=2983214 RepID=UPI0023F7E7FC|nr:hypothetical protein [Bifidobacterium sp. ESL0690]WEV47558.1 hypothetical protein OZX62_04620 [Bifidobacterium sp. ESL0690]